MWRVNVNVARLGGKCCDGDEVARPFRDETIAILALLDRFRCLDSLEAQLFFQFHDPLFQLFIGWLLGHRCFLRSILSETRTVRASGSDDLNSSVRPESFLEGESRLRWRLLTVIAERCQLL
jgi:hypothetical protein